MWTHTHTQVSHCNAHPRSRCISIRRDCGVVLHKPFLGGTGHPSSQFGLYMGVRLTCAAFVFILLAFCAFLQSGQILYQASRTCVAQASAQAADQSQVSVDWIFGRSTSEWDQSGQSNRRAETTTIIQPWRSKLPCNCPALPQLWPMRGAIPVRRTAPTGCSAVGSAARNCKCTISKTASRLGGLSNPTRRREDGGKRIRQEWTQGSTACSWSRQRQQAGAKSSGSAAATSVATPAKASATVKTEAIEERSQGMSALLAQLASSRDSLPPELQQLVDKELEQDSRMTTKVLRRQVTLQGQARKELSSLGKAREQFLAEWAQYIADLFGLLEKDAPFTHMCLEGPDE